MKHSTSWSGNKVHWFNIFSRYRTEIYICEENLTSPIPMTPHRNWGVFLCWDQCPSWFLITTWKKKHLCHFVQVGRKGYHHSLYWLNFFSLFYSSWIYFIFSFLLAYINCTEVCIVPILKNLTLFIN
jgi:hypothetical protein